MSTGSSHGAHGGSSGLYESSSVISSRSAEWRTMRANAAAPRRKQTLRARQIMGLVEPSPQAGNRASFGNTETLEPNIFHLGSILNGINEFVRSQAPQLLERELHG